MIKIINGNLLDATEDIIGHQVNCKGVMGAGIALKLSRKYPTLLKQYKEHLNTFGAWDCLGTCFFASCQDKLIANLFGQFSYGRDRQYTYYSELNKALWELKSFAIKHNETVALPYKIGCNLGGGNWDIVYKLIEENFKDYEVSIYKLEE